MPRVPYDPTKKVIQPQGQPRVNASGAINAIGREAEANREIASSISGLAEGIYRDKMERDTFADRRRLDYKIQEEDDKLLAGIKAIEVKDGVDFQAEVDSLVGEFEQSLTDWVETSGNVKHGAFQREFSTRVHDVVEKAKADGRVKVDELDRARNIGAAKKAIDLGIRMGNPDQIEKGVFLMHAEKAKGVVSKDEADLMYEKHVKSMQEMQDQEDLTTAKNLLAEGDIKGFLEKVDSLQLSTEKEKQTIKREESSRAEYNRQTLVIQETNELELLKGLKEDISSFSRWDKTKGHKSTLAQRVNVKIDHIEREQSRNAAQFSAQISKTGEFDAELFDQMANRDDEAGLPQEGIDEFRESLIVASDAFISAQENEEFMDQLEDDETYKKISSKIVEKMLNPSRNKGFETAWVPGDHQSIDNIEDHAALAKRIKKSSLDERGKVKLYGMLLDLQSADFSNLNRVYSGGTGRGGSGGGILFQRTRDITDMERSSMQRVFDGFRKSLEVRGYSDTLYQEYKSLDNQINRFYTLNPEATPEQAKAFEDSVMQPLFDRMLQAHYGIR